MKQKIAIGLALMSLWPALAWTDAGPSPLTSENIRAIIRDTGDFMLTMQNRAGDFIYEYWPYSGEKTRDDSVVRQLGTAPMLATAYEITGEKRYLDAMKRMAEFWLRKSQTDTGGGKTIRYFDSPKGAELGGPALFYVGVSLLYTKDQGWWQKYSRELTEIENFLIWMKKGTDGFAMTYTPGMTTVQRNTSDDSGFYDGEALLALARYDRILNTGASKELVYRVYRDLTSRYKRDTGEGLYLWLMKSSKELYRTYRDPLFFEFARDFHGRFMKKSTLPAPNHVNNCALLEGISAYRVLELEATGKNDAALTALAEHEMARLSELQVTKDSVYWVWMGKRSERLVPRRGGVGGFLTSLSEPRQRIDFQQHCADAFADTLYLLEHPAP